MGLAVFAFPPSEVRSSIVSFESRHGMTIFGFAPPNTRHNCDTLAEAGFFVIMPDLFRGSGRRDPAFERPTEEAVDTDLYEKVMPFLKAKGYSVVGLVGFCFGGGYTSQHWCWTPVEDSSFRQNSRIHSARPVE